MTAPSNELCTQVISMLCIIRNILFVRFHPIKAEICLYENSRKNETATHLLIHLCFRSKTTIATKFLSYIRGHFPKIVKPCSESTNIFKFIKNRKLKIFHENNNFSIDIEKRWKYFKRRKHFILWLF